MVSIFFAKTNPTGVKGILKKTQRLVTNGYYCQNLLFMSNDVLNLDGDFKNILSVPERTT